MGADLWRHELFKHFDDEPIHVTVPGSAQDPRIDRSIPGVVIHRVPGKDELRETFARARELGLLDPAALRASRARVEWRPSLAMLDEVIAEFCD